jgi:hypothetical protein
VGVRERWGKGHGRWGEMEANIRRLEQLKGSCGKGDAKDKSLDEI